MKRVLPLAFFAVVCSGQQGAAKGWWNVNSEAITSEGHIYHLRGHAEMRGNEIVFRADQIDYNEDKAVIHLSGHVTIETKNEASLRADDADYDVNSGSVTLRLKLVPAP